MDDFGITATATALSQAKTAEAVQTAVLKKAMEIGAEGAMALIQAATQTAQAVNPPNLGNNIDLFA